MSLNGTGIRTATVKLGRQPPVPMMRVGSTTQRFFEEGEQHEAAEWTDTVLPPDDAPETDPDAEFDSFDKIPKKRSPLITLAAIGACLLIGVAAWAMAFGILRTGRSVEESAKALVGEATRTPVPPVPTASNTANPATTASPGAPGVDTSAPTAGAESGRPPAQQLQQAPGEAPPSGPVVVPMAPNSPTTPPTIAKPRAAAATTDPGVTAVTAPASSSLETVGGATSQAVVPAPTLGAANTGDRQLPMETRALAADSPGASSAPTGLTPGVAAPTSGNVRPSRSPEEAPIPSARDTAATAGRDERRDERAPPLRGYVWSPSAKALVPAEPSLPTTAPDFARQSPPAPSSSSASSSSPSSTTSGAANTATAPAASSAVVPSHGVVAPPSTGTEPTERPAPLPDGVQPAPFSPKTP